ncbi:MULTISPECIES: ornithine cyclodeaminase family protein [Clostridium]|jgi:ornithine cyclodeaminase|uniref:Delta(1)-pyrroline-2-carboxylate reductase n=2 Tax=Clostridium TaxID=1485 RepID=A0A7U4JQE9_CLOSG|nr:MULTISPECIES: ornithine cyclodeaminase family protein [Clostridium]AJD30212.1 shikimate / quinate 5-dehydrogenase family protein [Clostridium botulinum Prevot_594]AVP60270.1 ornithine cyclodeaminase family protein [Clostridium botulinum]AKC63379.1 alanine dehydrogenase Ala [Clostridium sporogenes]AKJ90556.1 ornithine cyclodeaminase [Clostridium sporogenes]AVP63933.1 ornithine cyclodeaminase family protein [Clostridium botulinum]
MLILTAEDIKRVFTMRDAIEADKEAFRLYSTNKAEVPLRTNINIPKYKGTSLFMPGYVEELDTAGIKIVSVFPENPKLGKPAVPAQMILLDGKTGEISAIMDGTYLTQLRTGASAGAATDILAKQDSKIGALIGTGGQALCQLEALLSARNLKVVKVYSRNIEKVKAFVEEAKEKLGHYGTEIIGVDSSDEAIENADVITVVTTATSPVFDGEKVKKGAHINGVGSYMKHMQEIDEYIISKADKIYLDSKEAVLSEAGDFIIPIQKGIITEDIITGELGQVISKTIEGRQSENEITLFKSVGIAVQDVVTAYRIYEKALKNKVGKEIEI